MNIFVLFILGYVLYRFIGGFLIPLFRTTGHMRQQFNNMKQPGQDGQSTNQSSQGFSGQPGQQPTADSQRTSQNPGASKVGEYIDFEEVK
ncbi:MAG TPA: DUF4834 family protein [Puia sp.]|jgi:hypothetical protein|nr:DUF4834 family protein [Puia sp.]